MIAWTETRWALMHGDDSEFMLGVYCWDAGQCDDQPSIRTFRTKKMALEAKERLNSYKEEAKIIKVKVTIGIQGTG